MAGRLTVRLDPGDPFSEVTSALGKIFTWAAEHQGAMSDEEYAILGRTASVLADNDPHWPTEEVNLMIIDSREK